MFGRNNKSIEGGVCRVIMPERELGSSWKCKAIITLDIRIMCIPIVRMYRYVVCQYAKIMLNSHLIMMKWTIVSGLAYYYITLNFCGAQVVCHSAERYDTRGLHRIQRSIASSSPVGSIFIFPPNFADFSRKS